MSTVILERPRAARHVPSTASRSAQRARRQWAWLLAGLALAFSVPFLFADLLTIDRDLYYGIYAAAVFGFCALWLRFSVESAHELLTHNLRRGVLLGAVFAVVTAAIVFTETATAHPKGLGFAAAIVWRGIVYGATDGVLLSVFPILAVFGAFSTRPLRERGKRAVAAIGVLALGVSLLFTAVYHLGYPDFRGSKVRKPMIGDVVWSTPTLVTLSPVGAPIAHIGLHVAAVVHAYDTETFLPPHETGSRTMFGSGTDGSVPPAEIT
jgi:hypothetical protein